MSLPVDDRRLTAEQLYLLPVRGPDVTFVSRERVRALLNPEQAFPGPPDLAVEILSPSNTPSDVRAVYRLLLAPRVLRGDAELDGEDVLPGLRLVVADLFAG